MAPTINSQLEQRVTKPLLLRDVRDIFSSLVSLVQGEQSEPEIPSAERHRIRSLDRLICPDYLHGVVSEFERHMPGRIPVDQAGKELVEFFRAFMTLDVDEMNAMRASFKYAKRQQDTMTATMRGAHRFLLSLSPSADIAQSLRTLQSFEQKLAEQIVAIKSDPGRIEYLSTVERLGSIMHPQRQQILRAGPLLLGERLNEAYLHAKGERVEALAEVHEGLAQDYFASARFTESFKNMFKYALAEQRGEFESRGKSRDFWNRDTEYFKQCVRTIQPKRRQKPTMASIDATVQPAAPAVQYHIASQPSQEDIVSGKLLKAITANQSLPREIQYEVEGFVEYVVKQGLSREKMQAWRKAFSELRFSQYVKSIRPEMMPTVRNRARSFFAGLAKAYVDQGATPESSDLRRAYGVKE